VAQHDTAWLASATPAQVDAAHREGRLTGLYGGPARFEVTPGVRWTEADLEGPSPDQIADAMARGDLADVLSDR